jgi:hypothetical protein
MNGWMLGPHALSTETIKVIQSALAAGWIIGLHYHFAGGRGPEAVTFENYQNYENDIRGSRPGDKFLLWGVAELLEQDVQLMAGFAQGSENHDQASTHAHSSMEKDLARIQQYLSRVPGPKEYANEVFVAARIDTASRPVAFVTDLDGYGRIEQIIKQSIVGGGERYVFPLNTIDAPEFQLLCVKRANDEGEVPLVGTY